MITMKEAAATLNGGESRKEGSPELFALMKTARLVAAFGVNDDLLEFCGAVREEVDAYAGWNVFFTKAGILENDCDEACPYFAQLQEKATKIEAIWCPDESRLSWRIKADIPHETFTIVEDGTPFCEGIVFSLDDCAD